MRMIKWKNVSIAQKSAKVEYAAGVITDTTSASSTVAITLTSATSADVEIQKQRKKKMGDLMTYASMIKMLNKKRFYGGSILDTTLLIVIVIGLLSMLSGAINLKALIDNPVSENNLYPGFVSSDYAIYAVLLCIYGFNIFLAKCMVVYAFFVYVLLSDDG